MKHDTSAILPFIKKLNADYWLPAIQREFVWKEAQICKLFDSLMRGYPIGSFLIWETKSPIRRRKFCQDWHKDIDSTGYFLQADESKKRLVLDGQQRLNALLVGCMGSFSKKLLHFNITSRSRSSTQAAGEIPEALYEFSFRDFTKNRDWNWVSFKSILESPVEGAIKITSSLKQNLDCDGFRNNHELILENIDKAIHTFKFHPYCAYMLLSKEECNDNYDDNDVVEIFVRANSGGTKLEKSELLFALLASKWDEASEKLGELESTLEDFGFIFSRDYFLKACLILLGKKAQYDVKKFRNEETLEELKRQWQKISDAITDVVNFLPNYTPIGDSKALPSKNALLPLIAYRYHHKKAWDSEITKETAKDYLVRTAVAGTFNGAKDDLLNILTDVFSASSKIDLDKVFKAIQEKNRSLVISAEKLFSVQYQTSKVLLVMKLIFPQMMFIAANKDNMVEVDHLFSKKILKKAGRTKTAIDQLANLCPLDSRQNKQKAGRTLSVWLNDMSPDDQVATCAKLLIPSDRNLWEEKNFDAFIEERKSMILQAPEIKEILGEFNDEDEVEE